MIEKVNPEEVVSKKNGTGTAVVQRVVLMDQNVSGVEVSLYVYFFCSYSSDRFSWEDLPTIIEFVEEQTGTR